MEPIRLALLTVFAAYLGSAQTADGFIKIGSDRRELHHARATRLQDDSDKSKQTIHLILSESPIPAKALFDDMALFEVRRDHSNQLVELNLREGDVNWFLNGKEMEGTLSLSQSPNPFPFTIAGEIVKGKIDAKSDASGDRKPYEISVTYSAVLEKQVVEPPPTPADAISAQKHPATIAYINLINAIRAGDKAKIMAAAPEDQRKQIDTPDFPKMLKLMQMMQPSGIKVLKAVEKNGEATLTLKATQDGTPQQGEATLKFEGGKWILRNENWRNAK